MAADSARRVLMLLTNQASSLRCVVLGSLLLLGCEEEPAKKEPPPAKASAAPVAATPPPAAPSAEPPPKDRDDCPKGSKGPGTSAKPCLAGGDARMMEVKYTGKTTDEGPKFSIVNKADTQVLYGSLAVYFYDKAGKQLQVTSDGKPHPMQACSG